MVERVGSSVLQHSQINLHQVWDYVNTLPPFAVERTHFVQLNVLSWFGPTQHWITSSVWVNVGFSSVWLTLTTCSGQVLEMKLRKFQIFFICVYAESVCIDMEHSNFKCFIRVAVKKFSFSALISLRVCWILNESGCWIRKLLRWHVGRETWILKDYFF